jgi:hypothetical protein
VSDIEELPATDLVWGCEAIGKIINRNNRQTFHLLESGALPAKKVGHRWVASRSRLLAFLVGERDR